MVIKMAMLAEQRRKKKMSVDPRGSCWADDDTKFGQKLMEKMGWSKGKGLGAKEDGKTEHVKVALRTDNRGVGCSKNHADNWIAHQDDFNALLADLGQSHQGGGNGSEEETSKVSNLEQKSKTSRGRVHYQKFTKGKDLSLKSETDLDCVFGKRKSQSEGNTPLNQSEANSDASDTEGQTHGLKTVTSSDSIQGYFAKKMAEKMAKLKREYVESNDTFTESDDTKAVKHKNEHCEVKELINSNENHEVERKSRKKSKKSKKVKDATVDNDHEELLEEKLDVKDVDKNLLDTATKDVNKKVMADSSINENIEENDIKKRKKKSKKCKKSKFNSDETNYYFEERNETAGLAVDADIEYKPEIKKNKKSKKHKKNQDFGDETSTYSDIKDTEVPIHLMDEDEDKLNVSNMSSSKKKSEKSHENSVVDDCGHKDLSETSVEEITSLNGKEIKNYDEIVENKEPENSKLHKSPTEMETDGDCSAKVSEKSCAKKRKLEDANDILDSSNEATSKKKPNTKKRKKSKHAKNKSKLASEKGLWKTRAHCSDGSLTEASAKAFTGSNVIHIKGYSGLNNVTVKNGLKRKHIYSNNKAWVPVK